MRVLVKKSKSKAEPEAVDQKLIKARNELLAINYNRENPIWLLNKYQEIFNDLPTGKPSALVFLKLSYHFFKESTPPEQWKKKAERTLQNYKAAMNMELYGFSESLRGIISSEIKGEKEMAKKPTAVKAGGKGMSAEQKKVFSPVKGKTLGLGIVATWVHLFKENKLTDEQMDSFMKKEYPTRNVGTTVVARGKYNKGTLTKGIIPKPLSVPKGGEKAKGEVKAKVKVKVK